MRICMIHHSNGQAITLQKSFLLSCQLICCESEIALLLLSASLTRGRASLSSRPGLFDRETANGHYCEVYPLISSQMQYCHCIALIIIPGPLDQSRGQL